MGNIRNACQEFRNKTRGLEIQKTQDGRREMGYKGDGEYIEYINGPWEDATSVCQVFSFSHAQMFMKRFAMILSKPYVLWFAQTL